MLRTCIHGIFHVRLLLSLGITLNSGIISRNAVAPKLLPTLIRPTFQRNRLVENEQKGVKFMSSTTLPVVGT